MKASLVKKISFTGIQIMLMITLTGNSQDLKDFDGNTYRTIPYGTQVWIAANLAVSHFRNGDPVPEAKTPEEWVSAGLKGTPAWCYYDNDPQNGKLYGKLYNWYAINDPRGLAPAGWHISANADWSMLIKNLKGVDIAGTKLKSSGGWKSKKGTNEIGFAAIPGGSRDSEGKFNDVGKACQWWSNSAPVEVKPSNKIFSLLLDDNSIEIKYIQAEKGAGFSVRCEKD